MGLAAVSPVWSFFSMPSYAKLCQVSRMCIKAQNVYQMMHFAILLYISFPYMEFSKFGFLIHYFSFDTHFSFQNERKMYTII